MDRHCEERQPLRAKRGKAIQYRASWIASTLCVSQRRGVRVCLLVAIVATLGCTQTTVSQSTWRKMTPLHFCKQQCFIKKQNCQQTCENSCQKCQKKAKIEALYRYDDYIALQRRQGKVVAREGNAFLDPLACTKWTCNCTQDYEVCKAVCTGQVKPFGVSTCCSLSFPPQVTWWNPLVVIKG